MVWSVDGNYVYPYFDHPHILLFVAGLATLFFLGLPYTLLLFFMQWFRRLPLPVGVLLTLYAVIMQPYNGTAVLINESSLFANLSILAGFGLVSSLFDQQILQTGIAFLQFSGIILYALFQILCRRCKQDGCCNYNNVIYRI